MKTATNSLAGLDIRAAANDRSLVTGLTHDFYRYPARFSPKFAAAAIEQFTEPGDLVLDPFAGGGTTVVEGLVRRRVVIGNELNSLGLFVTRVKTTPLSRSEQRAIKEWATRLDTLSYSTVRESNGELNDPRLRNLTLPKARFIKKIVLLALDRLHELGTAESQDFARCAILSVSQAALDGRRRRTSVEEFKALLTRTTLDMLSKLVSFMSCLEKSSKSHVAQLRKLIYGDARALPDHNVFGSGGTKAKLVVTSPPYPGIHVLYHRWQVDGRKETPAPYWIADCMDGAGASYYTFGNRQEAGQHSYFATSLEALTAIRRVISDDGTFVQLVGFSDPRNQLPRYLRNMRRAGFREVNYESGETYSRTRRIWREVPNRKWHANMKGGTPSSKEVVLIHRPA